MASSGVERESKWEAERVWVSREATGVLLFMPASVQRGQDQLGAWHPCGGKALLPVVTVANLKLRFSYKWIFNAT